MTASIAALGLVPLLFADGPGSEILEELKQRGAVPDLAYWLEPIERFGQFK